MDPSAQTYYPTNPHRCGQRILGAAEGVLVALRHCRLDEAFTDIVQTAKRHNVAPMGLAEALVAIAENDTTRDLDAALVAAVDRAWGALLDRTGHDTDSRARTTAAADDDGVHIGRTTQTHWTPMKIGPGSIVLRS